MGIYNNKNNKTEKQNEKKTKNKKQNKTTKQKKQNKQEYFPNKQQQKRPEQLIHQHNLDLFAQSKRNLVST